MKNRNNANLIDPYSFPFSPSLEALYQLEEVDPSTIRKMAYSEEKKEKKEKDHLKESFSLEEAFLPFQDSIKETRASLVLDEPIDLLDLPFSIQQILEAEKIKTIGDLRDSLKKNLSWGTGHTEEIQKKMAYYLQGRLIRECKMIEWNSIAKILLFSIDPIRGANLFEEHRIFDFFSFAFKEKARLPGLRKREKKDAEKSLKEEWRFGELKEFIEKYVHQVSEVFLKPWVRKREGIVTQEEIAERIFRISDHPFLALKMIPLIQEILEPDIWLFEKSFFSISETLFCADEKEGVSLRICLHTLLSYFYSKKAVYSYQELFEKVFRDVSKRWIYFSKKIFDKMIEGTPQIRKERKEKDLILSLFS